MHGALQLFCPDIFSDPVPATHPVTVAVRMQMQTLARNWKGSIGDPAEIRWVGAIEVNSNNFVVEGDAGTAVFKRLARTRDRAAVERHLELLRWLQCHGVAVPTVLPGTDGLVLDTPEGLWCALEFVDGRFFSGDTSELRPTAESIGELLAACRSLPCAPDAGAAIHHVPEDDHAVYRAALARRDEWPAIFGVAMAHLLDANWEVIARTRNAVEASGVLCERHDVQVCHCDLHPHNLVIAGDRVAAFLDFDSFVEQDPAVAMAFAIFKLVRQHAVRCALGGEAAIGAAGAAFASVILERYPLPADAIERLELLAKAEVLRRVLIILRLNLRSEDASWNHVLPMHLAGLSEIDMIFADV